MKFEKLVGFGDSWMWGDELLDPLLHDHPDRHPVLIQNTPYRESRCFLGRLAQHYDLVSENFGIAGGSLQSTVWTYLWWLRHETVPLDRCLILVALTDANRHSFYNPGHVTYSNDAPWHRFIHSAWIHSGHSDAGLEWTNMVKSHMVLTDCDESQNLAFDQTVLFFEGQRCMTGAGMLQFNSVARKTSRTPVSSLLWNGLALSQIVTDPAHLAAMGHPNEKGHERIRDALISEIDHAILA